MASDMPERIFEGAALKFRACCSPDTAHALREAVEWVWATAQREAVTATTPTTHQRTMDALREAEKALEAQIRAHGLLCRSAGLDAQAHADGTSQARAALTRIKGDVT